MLLQSSIIQLPNIKSYEPTLFKPYWWKEDEYCEYHQGKGQKIARCWTLKNIIQDLIEQGIILMDNS
jgi:hypothetical protein